MLSVLLLCAAVAGAQSLQELAKKEKERRKSKESEKTAVVEADGGPPKDQGEEEGLTAPPLFEPPDEEARPLTLDERIDDREQRVPRMYEKWEGERDRCSADADRFDAEKSSIPSCQEADALFKEYRAALDNLSDLKRQRFWIRYRNGEIQPKP